LNEIIDLKSASKGVKKIAGGNLKKKNYRNKVKLAYFARGKDLLTQKSILGTLEEKKCKRAILNIGIELIIFRTNSIVDFMYIRLRPGSCKWARHLEIILSLHPFSKDYYTLYPPR
jgi:hypothetical protein